MMRSEEEYDEWLEFLSSIWKEEIDPCYISLAPEPDGSAESTKSD